VSHWSSRLLAAELKVNHVTITKAWRQFGVRPWKAEDVQVLHRSRARGQGHRCDRALPAPAGERDRAVRDEKSQIQALNRTQKCCRCSPARRATHPRLRPARHHHTVRRAGGRHRPGHRAVQEPAPPPGVLAFLKHLARAYPTRAAPGDGQLRRPQASECEGLAGREPRIQSTSPRPRRRG
jgi:hypothetical protein